MRQASPSRLAPRRRRVGAVVRPGDQGRQVIAVGRGGRAVGIEAESGGDVEQALVLQGDREQQLLHRGAQGQQVAPDDSGGRPSEPRRRDSSEEHLDEGSRRPPGAGFMTATSSWTASQRGPPSAAVGRPIRVLAAARGAAAPPRSPARPDLRPAAAGPGRPGLPRRGRVAFHVDRGLSAGGRMAAGSPEAPSPWVSETAGTEISPPLGGSPWVERAADERPRGWRRADGRVVPLATRPDGRSQ